MHRVGRGCCGRVVLFLWKRDGWGKAVVGTGHPCTLPQQRSSKQEQEQMTDSLVYMQHMALADELNACILVMILLHPASTASLLGCGCLSMQTSRC